MSNQHKSLFSMVYEDYLVYARKKQKNQSFESLVYNFNSKILPFFKDMYLEDITSKDIIAWEDYIYL